MARHRTTGAGAVPILRGMYFPYFHFLVILKWKFLIVTNVAQATQFGWLANEAGEALSHPPNSAASHNTLRAFAEVNLVFNFPTRS
jgi:hypothetical protein